MRGLSVWLSSTPAAMRKPNPVEKKHEETNVSELLCSFFKVTRLLQTITIQSGWLPTRLLISSVSTCNTSCSEASFLYRGIATWETMSPTCRQTERTSEDQKPRLWTMNQGDLGVRNYIHTFTSRCNNVFVPTCFVLPRKMQSHSFKNMYSQTFVNLRKLLYQNHANHILTEKLLICKQT